MIAIRLPADIARVLATLSVPGDREAQGHFHITLLNLGDGVSIEQLAKATTAIFNVTKDTKPFTAEVSSVATFDKGDNGYPVICPVVSDALHTLQKRLGKALDAAGVSYSKKFPVFKPHVTLAYADDDATPETVKNLSFEPIEWGVGEVMLFGGDSGDGTFTATFPLALEAISMSKSASTPKSDLFRPFVRLARQLRV